MRILATLTVASLLCAACGGAAPVAPAPLARNVTLVAFLHRAFELSPLQYSDLFADYLHPSAAGYKVMAETWFEAITKRR